MKPRRRRQAREVAVLEARLKIVQAMQTEGSLRLPGTQNKYWVPSTSRPGHKFYVHLTPSDRQNSCTCIAHGRGVRPCKHVLALKKVLENARSN
jgi:hypothetical protein